MKKITKVIIGTGLVVTLSIGGLFANNKYGASDSWVNQIISQAGDDMALTGFNKTEELLSDGSITGQMKIMLDPEIAAQQKELERLLEEYYRMKIEGLTDTEEYKAVEEQIARIKETTLNHYKKEIDAAFAGQ